MTNTTYNKTTILILTGIFSALIAVGAFITIPVPPVPITLQFFFAAVATFLLPKYWGAVSAALYVGIGLIGVPVFTQGGGIGYVLKPTFGYLLGFILGNLICGYILDKAKVKKFKTYFLAGLVNLILVYTLGVAYFYCLSNLYLGTPVAMSYLMIYAFAIFVPGNVVEIVLGAIVAPRVNKITKLRD